MMDIDVTVNLVDREIECVYRVVSVEAAFELAKHDFPLWTSMVLVIVNKKG